MGCGSKFNDILEVPLLKTGFFAVILASGLCWLVNTFVGAQTDFITENLSALTNKYPWIYIIAVFLVGALTSSQASTTMIMIPIAIALKLPAYIIVGGWMACSSNYFIPDSSQCIAGLAFDTAGTTKIEKSYCSATFQNKIACHFLLIVWKEQEEDRQLFFSDTKRTRAIEFMDYMISEF